MFAGIEDGKVVEHRDRTSQSAVDTWDSVLIYCPHSQRTSRNGLFWYHFCRKSYRIRLFLFPFHPEIIFSVSFSSLSPSIGSCVIY
ncbi:hypothetical protein BDP27DRAFT_401693 [Rhodocollybia butyracea]|uniref:Uncharacterized protein n=1 Tax=Rhodocollybia butyracea TaxID=206335 RepID=A0A9P5PEH8_9AGAR|nr:hypothetical protein BDP27DRAFT_401693 [Rhodocollybia butyracea]